MGIGLWEKVHETNLIFKNWHHHPTTQITKESEVKKKKLSTPSFQFSFKWVSHYNT